MLAATAFLECWKWYSRRRGCLKCPGGAYSAPGPSLSLRGLGRSYCALLHIFSVSALFIAPPPLPQLRICVDGHVNELESFKAVNEQVSLELKSENKRLQERLDNLSNAIDDHEQRNRNNCLLLHGVEELDGENTDDLVLKIINEKLELPMVLENIHRSWSSKCFKEYTTKSNKATGDNLSFQGLSCKTIGVLQQENVKGYRYFYN